MFGLNPIRKIDYVPHDGKLAVQEVFYTIQGEGPYAGLPAIFIRLAGCHLACTFCDTEFESGMHNRLTTDEVLALVHKLSDAEAVRPNLIVITGGEPLRQSIGDLVYDLMWGDHMFAVQVETAGNLWDPQLERVVNHMPRFDIVCSPKTSHVHPKIARYCRHYKYVVKHGDSDTFDGLPNLGTQKVTEGKNVPLFRPWSLADYDVKQTTVWVSPMDEHDLQRNHKNVAHAADLSMRFGYRLSLQMHKLIGLP